MTVTRPEIDADPEVSVILPTYNRVDVLLHSLQTLLSQHTHHPYEIVVIDNNSTDGTRAAVERVAASSVPRVRYVFEPRQGVSSARNAGIGAARGGILAFTDDDVRVDAEWIGTICRVFGERTDVGCIGGKILPLWDGTPPAWLTPEHWAPLALLDFGDLPLVITRDRKRCLLTANMACRREVFDRVGPFRPELQRVKDSIGSMEDYEWLLRFWESGGDALYVPELRAWTLVPPARMTRAYHRRWHTGHGYYFALLNDPDFEPSQKFRLFDVPAHAYRAALADGWSWLTRIVRADANGAFLHETRLRFFRSYVRTRRARPQERASGAAPAAGNSALKHSSRARTGTNMM